MQSFASKLPSLQNVVIVLKKPFDAITNSNMFKTILKGLAVFASIVFVGKLIYNNLNPNQQEFVDNVVEKIRVNVIDPLVLRIRRAEEVFKFLFEGVGTQLVGGDDALSDEEIEKLDLNHSNPIVRAHNIILLLSHKIRNAATIAEEKITEIIWNTAKRYFSRHSEIKTPERFQNLKQDITTGRQNMLSYMAENDERVKEWKTRVFQNLVFKVDIDDFNSLMETISEKTDRPKMEIEIREGNRVLVLQENTVIDTDANGAYENVTDTMNAMNELFGKDVDKILSTLNLAIGENGEVDKRKKVETIVRILSESYDSSWINDTYEYKNLSQELKEQITEKQFEQITKAIDNSAGFIKLKELAVAKQIIVASNELNKKTSEIQNERQKSTYGRKDAAQFEKKYYDNTSVQDIVAEAAKQQERGRSFEMLYAIEGIKSNIELFQNSGTVNGIQPLFSNLFAYLSLNNLLKNGVETNGYGSMTQNAYLQANEGTFLKNRTKSGEHLIGEYDTVYVFDDNVALVNTINIELDGGSRGRICASIKKCLSETGSEILRIVERSIEELELAIEYINFQLSEPSQKSSNPISKRIASIYQKEQPENKTEAQSTMQAVEVEAENHISDIMQQQMQQLIDFRKIRIFQVPEHIMSICDNNTAKEMSSLSETPVSQNMV